MSGAVLTLSRVCEQFNWAAGRAFLGIVCVEGTLANGWLIAFARLLSVGECPGMIIVAYREFTYMRLRTSRIY